LTLGAKLQDNLNKKQPRQGFFYRFCVLIIQFILYINGGLSAKGTENIPLEGGVIIASNHISYLDPPLLSGVLPRRATFMARRGLFKIPVLGWFINLFSFPVDRERTLPSSIKEAIKRVKNGELLVMFPEGRRSETGKLLEGKRGIGTIASFGRVPVIPAFITGSDKALPPGATWLRRVKISVIFGKPVSVAQIEGEGHVLYNNISQKIMSEIKELSKHHADTGS
jgi:1-acyl-sn-glycerol-3-phosphate acyltransferase